MKKLKAYEIRQMWLDFFSSKMHEVIPSASLLPQDDPTLLWINAGVAPLKKYFDGREKPQNPRLTNAQKSIRTNDIENVGKTARHHTFFEMLGNFSIGDYFREEVLTWAYELLFDEKWFAFDKDLIYITYYTKDLDTFNKWVSLGVKEDHLIPLDDNFWEIGEGPCGPDTEIFFDRGTKYDPENIGIKMLKEDIENDRYIEIWNIVFSQFNSEPGKPRELYKELPSKNIDTGAGLERIACVMQETETNYESDLFMPYIKFIEENTGIRYEGQMSFKVIVDHIRSITFALADGATFGNSGRGYVLRRILRRAVRYARKLNINEPFLYKMVSLVAQNMKEYYPYLLNQVTLVSKLVKIEEENFWKTLEKGEKKLNELISSLGKDKVLRGEDVFLLYDTFGFPLELTIEAAAEKGIVVDEEGFKLYLAEQKNRARSARNSIQSMNVQNEDYLNFKDQVKFIGYNDLHAISKVIGIFKDGVKVQSAKGDILLVCDTTPFYGESGGQVGDKGTIVIDGIECSVLDSIKLPNGQIAMVVDSEDVTVNINDTVVLDVDKEYRNNVTRNHSATHLMNQSLRNVLGSHVVQQGSLNNDRRLRFDFNHFTNLSVDEILKIEELTNEAIDADYSVECIQTSIEEAKKRGAQALFSEKYGDVVRVVDMHYSIELCGGTHVKSTKEIGKFAILSIESKGSGIFRVEAATGDAIEEEIYSTVSNVQTSIDDVKLKIDDLLLKAKHEEVDLVVPTYNIKPMVGSYIDIINKRNELACIQKVLKDLEKEYNQKYRNKNSADYDEYVKNIKIVDGVSLLVERVENLDLNVLKDIIDKITAPLDKAIVFFANVVNDKIIFICKNKNTNFNAGMLVKEAAIITGGNGGGRPDFAQAGGKDATKLSEALQTISQKVGF